MDIRIFFGGGVEAEPEAPSRDRSKRLQLQLLSILPKLIEQKKIESVDYTDIVGFRDRGGTIVDLDRWKRKSWPEEVMKILSQLYPTTVPHHWVTKKRILDRVTRGFEFTDEQREGIRRIVRFLADPKQSTFGLYGYAGSGKTTLITEMVGGLMRSEWLRAVAFVAPTNKAVDVMKSKLHRAILAMVNERRGDVDETTSLNTLLSELSATGLRIEFLTTHKLLDYQNDFDAQGRRLFTKGDKPKVSKFDLVIVDECSMISIQIVVDLFEEVARLKRRSSPKLLFVGDPAQLPPVNEQVSIIFASEAEDFSAADHRHLFSKETYDEKGWFVGTKETDDLERRLITLKNRIEGQKSFLMSTVVRAKDANLVGLCTDVRGWVVGEVKHPTPRNFIGPQVSIDRYTIGTSKIEHTWFNRFIEEVIEKRGRGIMLTWTNRQCNELNAAVRHRIFKREKLRRFEIGDLLILTEFYNIPEGEEAVGNRKNPGKKEEKETHRFYTSEQIRVVGVGRCDRKPKPLKVHISRTAQRMKNARAIDAKYHKILTQINAQLRPCRCWKLEVEKLNDDLDRSYTIYVPHRSSRPRLDGDREATSQMIHGLRKYLMKSYPEQMVGIDLDTIRPLWKEWNESFIDPFASVNYGFCTTVHKSQGSTYHDVYVDIDDLLRNPVENEAKRCLYTALTRAANSVHLLVTDRSSRRNSGRGRGGRSPPSRRGRG